MVLRCCVVRCLDPSSRAVHDAGAQAAKHGVGHLLQGGATLNAWHVVCLSVMRRFWPGWDSGRVWCGPQNQSHAIKHPSTQPWELGCVGVCEGD